MRAKFHILLITLLLLSCGSTKNEAELMADSKAYSELKSLVETGNFEFKAEVLYPIQTMDAIRVTNRLLRNTGNSGTRVNLDKGHGIKFMNGSANADLPFIGEVRISNSYMNSDDTGITFDNVIENYRIEEDKNLKVKFNVSNKTENFEVIMKFFPDKTADVNIVSSHRTSVKYRGSILPLKDEAL